MSSLSWLPIPGRRKRTIRTKPYHETHTREGKVKVPLDDQGWYPIDAVSEYNQLNGAVVRLKPTYDPSTQEPFYDHWIQIENGVPKYAKNFSNSTTFNVEFVAGSQTKFHLYAWGQATRLGSHFQNSRLFFGPGNASDIRTQFSADISGSPRKQRALKAYYYDWPDSGKFVKVHVNGLLITSKKLEIDVVCNGEANDGGFNLLMYIHSRSPYVQLWEQPNTVRCCSSMDDRSLGLDSLQAQVCTDLKLFGKTKECDQGMENYCDALRLQGKTDPACRCLDLAAQFIALNLDMSTIPIACLPRCQLGGYITANMHEATQTPRGCTSECINIINNVTDGGGQIHYDANVEQKCGSGGGGESSGGGGESSGGGGESSGRKVGESRVPIIQYNMLSVE